MSEVSLVDGHIDNEMTYLEELLQRNPLVIDGDKIRPHHKYTDDLYTGSKSTMTNYDRIKSMSVDEIAEFLEDDDYICMQYCNKKHCVEHQDNGECTAMKEGRKKACVQAVKNWLNSEVSDNER